MIIAEPEQQSFTIRNDHDFIVLASPGLYEKLNNQEVSECMNKVIREQVNGLELDIHSLVGQGSECMLKNSLYRKTL